MPFSLPLNFAANTNELGRLVVEFEASTGESQKDEYLRKSLVISCKTLSDIDTGQLRTRVVQVFASARDYDTDWFSKIVGDEAHFNYFLNNVESVVLGATGIDSVTRKRILWELGSLRATAVKGRSKVTVECVVDGIEKLRREICQAKGKQIKKAQRSAHHTKIVKTLCAITIVADAVAEAISPIGSPGAFAASIVVGGIRFIPTGT
jgi:hypothetical protein